MSKIKYLITAILITFLSFYSCPAPKAMAILTSNEVQLTTPRGSNILPGGQILAAPTIQDSFIFSKLIPFVIKYAIRLAIALAVIALIIGGYQYVTAYGNDEKHKTAQKTIEYALIGLVLAITAFGIVQIITNLKFT
jgi:hypothetical protein